MSAETTQSEVISKSAPLWSYGIGLSFLGAAAGYYVGASESPIVAAALPLLFGLVSGAGGLYIAKIDLTKRISRTRLTAIGLMLTTFVVCLMAGTVVGTALRTGIGLSAFFSELWRGSAEKKNVALDVSNLTTSDALYLALLRSNLQVLGTSEEEQQAILSLARAGISESSDRDQTVASLGKALLIAEKVRNEITTDIVPEEPAEEDDSQEAADKREIIDIADSLLSSLQKLTGELAHLKHYIETEKTPVPSQYLSERVRRLRRDIDDVISDRAASNWLLNQGSLNSALAELELFLMDFETVLARQSVDVGEEALESVNSFLKASGGIEEIPAEAPRASYRSRGIKP